MICKDARSLIAIPAILASSIVALVWLPPLIVRPSDRRPLAPANDVATLPAALTAAAGPTTGAFLVSNREWAAHPPAAPSPANSQGRGPRPTTHQIRFRPAPLAPAASRTTLLRLLPADSPLLRPATGGDRLDDLASGPSQPRPIHRRESRSASASIATPQPIVKMPAAGRMVLSRPVDAPAAPAPTPPASSPPSPSHWPAVNTLGQQLGLRPQVPTAKTIAAGGKLIVHRTAQPAATIAPTLMPPAVDADEAMRRWSRRVDEAVRRLRQCRRLDAPAAAAPLRDLSALVPAGRQIARRCRDDAPAAGRRVAAVDRRLSLWRAVSTVPGDTAERTLVGVNGDPEATRSAPPVDSAMLSAIDALTPLLDQTGDAAGWHRALSIDRLARLGAQPTASAEDRAAAAAAVLARLARPSTEPTHRQLAARPEFTGLVTSLRRWVDRPLVVAELISHVERAEVDPVGSSGEALATGWSTLRFANQPAVRDVAGAIAGGYRRSNLRVGVTGDWLRRCLPPPATRTEPVAARVAGANVRGTSEVHTELDVRLVPHAGGWRIDLLTDGRVDSRSVGRRSAVAVGSTAAVQFATTTPLLVTPEWLAWVEPDAADVDTSVRLRMGSVRVGRVNTPLHRWPIVGPLGQRLVQSRFDDQRAAASVQTARRVRTEVASGVAEQLIESRTRAGRRAVDRVLKPLQLLDLDPRATGLSTTAERLRGEFLIAGSDQLAGVGDPDPAPRGSLIAASLHQSAINNLLDRLAPTGQPQRLVDVIDRTRQLFGGPLAQSGDAAGDPADGAATVDGEAIDPEVYLQLTNSRPISVQFEADQMELTIRVQELRGGGGPSLRRFVVRAHYRVDSTGPAPRLVRDGHLNIAGPGMSVRQRLPIRVVFNKVLSTSRSLPLLPPRMTEHPANAGLVLDPVSMRGGWLTWSLSLADTFGPSRTLQARDFGK